MKDVKLKKMCRAWRASCTFPVLSCTPGTGFGAWIKRLKVMRSQGVKVTHTQREMEIGKDTRERFVVRERAPSFFSEAPPCLYAYSDGENASAGPSGVGSPPVLVAARGQSPHFPGAKTHGTCGTQLEVATAPARTNSGR